MDEFKLTLIRKLFQVASNRHLGHAELFAERVNRYMTDPEESFQNKNSASLGAAVSK